MTESDNKPLYVTDPEQWVKDTVHGPDLACIVIFRGSWCKYDRHYLRKLGAHHNTMMQKESLKLIAWTSEGPAGAKKADEEWGLTKEFGYDLVIGDDSNALATYFIDDVVLEDLKIVSPADAHVENQVPAGSYPNGMVQPGMVWYAHHGTIVFQWTHPADDGCGWGGPNRPDPVDLWQRITRRKHALDHGNAIMPIHGNELKMCTSDAEVAMANCDIV